MSVLALLLVAVGVSADAFAVAVGQGLTMRRFHVATAAALAVTFGLAQAFMPLLGWLLGAQVEAAISSADHWVAFGLLALVGGRMLTEAVRDGGDPPVQAPPTGGARGGALLIAPRQLLVLSVATSIDALAVGISLALADVNIAAAVLLIGVVTCVLSFAGVALGYRAGARWRRPAAGVGGLVLVGIGVKILVDHLGVV